MMNYSVTFLVLLCATIFVACVAQDRSKWVDPHDMNLETEHLPLVHDRNTDYECECPAQKTCGPNHSFFHYKRLIGLLLSTVYLDRSDGMSNYAGILKLNLKAEDYDLLKSVVRSTEEDEQVFRKVDEVLSRVLIKPKHEVLVELFSDWTDKIYFTVFNRTTGMLVVCVVVLYCSYRLLKAEWGLLMVVKFLVFISWVVDFGFTWMHLLQVRKCKHKR